MSKTSKPIRSYNFKPDKAKLTIFPIKFRQSGSGSVAMHYNGAFICIQTHKMSTPFGYSSGFGDRFDPNLNVNLDKSEKSQQFLAGIRALEDLIIQHAFEKRREWGFFNNSTEADRATLEDFRSRFRSSIRESKDGRYPPTMLFKFQTTGYKPGETATIQTAVKNSSNEDINPEKILRRSQVIIITENPTIWVSAKGSFGINWEIEVIKVYPPEPYQGGSSSSAPAPAIQAGKLLIIDSDSEED